MRILVVDDAAENRYMLSSLLERHHEVLTAGNGREAWRILAREPVDLVITDILMPEMDGFQLCLQLRATPELATIPLVFYTATYTDERDEELALRIGAQRFIRKPVEPASFLRVIDEVLDSMAEFPPEEGTPPLEPSRDELKLYSQRLVAKLEEKMQALETEVRERKRIERELRESESKYRHLVQHSNDAIYLLEGERFVIVNDKFQEIFGISLEELNRPDFSFYELVAEKSRPLIRERARRLARGEQLEQKYEFTALSGDGREIEVEASVSYIRYGDRLATQGILRDITERKRLEAQLLQAQKLEGIGRLAGGIAHDFNNFLTAIAGYTHLLLQAVAPGSHLADDLEQIEQAVGRATRLTRQLLAFSRKSSQDIRIFNLNRVVSEMEQMLSRLVSENIVLTTRLDPTLGFVRADPGQMEQVIMNIVVNAVDAMPGGGRLTIETCNVDLDEEAARHYVSLGPGPCVMLAISDTGSGMDPDTTRHIFEPFFTTKQHGEGTGLGLSTVYGIVRQSGGGISVDSRPGAGTSFRILFPRQDRLGEDREQEEPPPESIQGQETVLVVEDSQPVRAMVVRTLQHHGYRVVEAGNARETMRLMAEWAEPPDVLLTDVVMPGIDGPELARRLLASWPDLKVILISGYSLDPAMMVDLPENQVGFIQKPFSPRTLLRQIRDLVDGNA